MLNLRKIKLGVGLLTLLVPPFLHATTVQTVNLVELVGRADRVFQGRCISVVTRQEKVAGFPVIEYTFAVTRAIKGTTDGSTVVFRQLQAAGKQVRGMPGMPQYAVGDHVVLFLKKDSRLGLTSPVGLGQGIFQLKNGPQGDPVVSNLVGNRRLTEGLTPQSGSQVGLSATDYDILQQEKPIPLDTFASIVTRIARFKGADDRNK